MIFHSKQIKGHGRGQKIGFPTINLEIPHDFVLDDGIYSAWVVIDNHTYKGALHYGPIPTFGDKEKNLEVYLLDVTNDNVPDTSLEIIEVDIVSYLRDVKKFLNVDDLSSQIHEDISSIRSMLS